MTAAGMWEILEYLMWVFTGDDSQYSIAPYVGFNGVSDTMEDMMICLVGTAVLCWLMWIHLGGRRRLLLFKPVDQFLEANWSV